MAGQHRFRPSPSAGTAPAIPRPPAQAAGHAAACDERRRVHVTHRHGVNATAQDIS